MDDGINLQCGDCGAHYQLDARGDVQGAACDNCGGTRFYRDQPSPTNSDGDLRNMVDSDSQKDQGGNPLGEGVIMGEDGEQSLKSDTHQRDNFMHGSVQLSHRVRPETFDMEPYPALWSDEHVAGTRESFGISDLWNNPVVQGVGNAAQDVANSPVGQDAAGFAQGVADSPVGQAVGQGATDLANSPIGQGAADAGNWAWQNKVPLGVGLGAGALAIGTGGLALPEEAAAAGAVGAGDAAATGIADAGAGAADAGATDAASAGATDAASAGKAAPSLMKRVLKSPVTVPMAAGKALYPAYMADKGLQFGEQMLNGGQPGGGQEPGGSSGYAMPGPNLGIQSFGSTDIPMLIMADLETPHSVKSVDEQHDDPEKQDQKEFNDGDKSPENMMNPNNEDSGQSGEDGVRNAVPGFGLGPNSPGIQRMMELMPLLMHYINNDQSGADDPVIQGLHEALENEHPGYMDNEHPDGPGLVEIMVNDHKTKVPKAANHQGPVTQEQKEAIKQLVDVRPELFGDILNQVQNAPNTAPLVDPSQAQPAPQQPMQDPQGSMPMPDPSQPGGGMAQPMQPMARTAAPYGRDTEWPRELPRPDKQNQFHYLEAGEGNVNAVGLGQCPKCGQHSLTPFNGMCQNCGFAMPKDSQDVLPQADPHGPYTLDSNEADFGMMQPHWGSFQKGSPDAGDDSYFGGKPGASREAFDSMVKEYGKEKGEEVYYATRNKHKGKEAAAMDIDVLQQIAQLRQGLPQNIQAQIDQMIRGEGPRQALPQVAEMARQMTGIVAKTADANNAVVRCPKCGSATTSLWMPESDDGSADKGHCHSCQNIFPLKKASRYVLTEFGNPSTVPAADQGVPQQSQSLNDPWVDSSGQPLVEGQVYSLKSPSYPVPDEVQIVSKKPHSLGVKLVGEFSNIMNPGDQSKPDFEINAEDLVNQKYSFEPEGSSADQQQQNPPLGGTPGMEQIPEQAPTTDETSQSYPNRGTMASYVTAGEEPIEENHELCHKCGGTHVVHTASSPTQMMHECYRCGAAWESEETDDFEKSSSADLSWVMDSNSYGDDFFAEMERHKGMRSAVGSRDIRAIAAKDERLNAIKDVLDSNARTAGRHYSPREQKALINEKGTARNSDMLDLEGTHYVTRYDDTGKANGLNAPDEHLVFGL